MGECLTGHIFSHDNPAGICAKIIAGGCKCDHLVGLSLHNLADYGVHMTIPLTEVRGLVWVPLGVPVKHLCLVLKIMSNLRKLTWRFRNPLTLLVAHLYIS